MASNGLMNMFGIRPEDMEQYRNLGPAVLARLDGIQRQLADIALSSAQRPEAFELDQAGNAPGGAAFDLPNPFTVPIGKRIIIYRVTSTAPAASGALLTYASAGGGKDGNSLLNVITAAPTGMTDSARGFVIRGGQTLVSSFLAVAAGGGICTVHYEGDMFTEELTHGG